MSKRGADHQLTNLNYKDENVEEVPGDYFQKASQQEISKRKIKPLRGKLPTMETKETTQAATTILGSLDSPFGNANSNVIKNPIIPSKELKVRDEEKSELSVKIKSLNNSFIDQLGSHFDKDNLVNFIPLCNDYIKFRKEILDKQAKHNFQAPTMPVAFDFGSGGKPSFGAKVEEKKPVAVKNVVTVPSTPSSAIHAPVPPASAKNFVFGGFPTATTSSAPKVDTPKFDLLKSESTLPGKDVAKVESTFKSPFSSSVDKAEPKPSNVTDNKSTPFSFGSTNTLAETKFSFGSKAVAENSATNSPAVSAPSTFKFEAKTSEAKTSTNPAVFNFAPKSSTAAVEIKPVVPAFNFAPNPSTAAAESKPAAPAFNFSSPASNIGKPAVPAFNFGSVNSATTTAANIEKSAVPAFNFGSVNSSKTTASSSEKPVVPTFSFGSVNSATTNTTDKPAPFSFASTTSTVGNAPPSTFGQSSFGTTPAAAPFQFKKAEEEDDGDDATSPPDQQVGETLMTGEGEENEKTAYSVKARIRVQTNATWEPIGVGMLKVNISNQDSKGRILLRADTNGRVLVNSRIFKGMTVTKKDAKVFATSLQIDGTLKTCLVSVRTEKDLDALINEITKLAQ